MTKRIQFPIRTTIELTVEMNMNENETKEDAIKRLEADLNMSEMFELYGISGDMVGVNEGSLELLDAEFVELEFDPDHRVMTDICSVVEVKE